MKNAVTIPGKWYFVVTCPECGQDEIVGPAPSPAEMPGGYAFSMKIQCDCGVETEHPQQTVQRVQAKAHSI